MKTVFNRTAAVVTATLIGACASVDHSGAYAPACLAFAGDTIELEGDRFVWDKFTDEVKIDSAGKVKDEFPAHPMRGHYTVQKNKLILKPDSDGVTSVFYLANDGGQNFVLNVMQHSAWQATGQMPKCALTRTERAATN